MHVCVKQNTQITPHARPPVKKEPHTSIHIPTCRVCFLFFCSACIVVDEHAFTHHSSVQVCAPPQCSEQCSVQVPLLSCQADAPPQCSVQEVCAPPPCSEQQCKHRSPLPAREEASRSSSTLHIIRAASKFTSYAPPPPPPWIPFHTHCIVKAYVYTRQMAKSEAKERSLC